MFSIMLVAIILGILAYAVVYYLLTTKTKKSKEYSMLLSGAVGIVVLWAYSMIQIFNSIQQLF